VPEHDWSPARGIGRANLIYTQHVNRKYRRTGRLRQNRFFSTPVDSGKYLWGGCRYVVANPVRALLARHAWEYRWSSVRHHVRQAPDPLAAGSPWLEPAERSECRRFLEERTEREEEARIRRTVMTGQPFGDAGFMDELEQRLGRALRPGK